MPDIVTLTINPAVDIFVNVGRVEPERKMRCSAPKRDPGGGGINVARVANRLGVSVAAIYPMGGAIGRLLLRLLEREAIDSIVIPAHVETRENFTAYEEESGQQYRFVLPGSTLHRAEWEACLEQLRGLKDKPQFIVVSGSIAPGVPEDFFAKVAQCAKAIGVKVALDTSGPALGAALEEGVTLVKPNQNELSELAGMSLDNDEARVAACRKLVDAGKAEIVALTLGGDGAMLVTKSRVLRAKPMDIEVVSAVGAGDSFLGGLVASLTKGEALDQAFRTAVAAGSAAVMSPGTELCGEQDVAKLMPKVDIREIATAAA